MPLIVYASGGVQMGAGQGSVTAANLSAEAVHNFESGGTFLGIGALGITAGIMTGEPLLIIGGGVVAVYGAVEIAIGLYQLHLVGNLVGPR
jgi:hypothetical protein